MVSKAVVMGLGSLIDPVSLPFITVADMLHNDKSNHRVEGGEGGRGGWVGGGEESKSRSPVATPNPGLLCRLSLYRRNRGVHGSLDSKQTSLCDDGVIGW